MEDVVILYASQVHLNSMLLLGELISKNGHPVTILSSGLVSAATSITVAPSVTYRCLPTPALPPNPPEIHAELYFEIPRLNNPDLREALEEISQKSRIRAVVIDFFCNAAYGVTTSMGIPTYYYFVDGAFNLCLFLHFPTIDETLYPRDIGDLNDFIQVPGCPPIHSRDFIQGMFFRKSNTYKHFLSTTRNMRKSAGILSNGVNALEVTPMEALLSGSCGPTPPVYMVGPLVSRSNSAVEHKCLEWLDSQPSKSVIFLCFGRRGLFSVEQLRAMAVGLENSGHRFLWSVRSPLSEDNDDSDLDALLFPEGFVERTKERGFVIKSWALQVEVLSHDSVAGFVTHCGWMAALEALLYAVPMIGWPLYAEQRLNRVCMVEEMKVALPLVEEEDGFVMAAELEKRVMELMDSENGRAVRRRAAEMKKVVEMAVEENGSSFVALEKFVESVNRY